MRRMFLFAAAILVAGPAVAAPPAKFLKDAIQGDYSESTLGKLIQARGASAEVRAFGAMLNRDHTNGLAQARAVAAREHLNIRPTMAPEARTERTRLHRLSGASFDREVRRYMIDDHKKDIANFEKQARTGDRPTAALANATLPVLRKHLATAESIRP